MVQEGMLRFGKLLKFMQNTMGLLKEEFMSIIDRNNDLISSKQLPTSPEEFHRYVHSH